MIVREPHPRPARAARLEADRGLVDPRQDGAAADGERVPRLDARLQEFISWIDRFPVPVGIKEACAVRGLKVGPLAVPMPAEKLSELDEFRCWFQNWLPVVVRPLAEPLSVMTAPAAAAVPTVMPGAPIARSAKPSPLKSPAASAKPNWSPGSLRLS